MEQPKGTSVAMFKNSSTTHIYRPLNQGQEKSDGVLILYFAVPCLAIGITLSVLIDNAGSSIWPLVIAMVLCAIGLSALALGVVMIVAPYSHEVLHIGCNMYGVWRQRGEAGLSQLPLDPSPRKAFGRSSDLTSVQLILQKQVQWDQVAPRPMYVNPAHVQIEEGRRKAVFGRGLSMAELEWLRSEIADTIQTVRKSKANQSVKVMMSNL